MNPSPSNRPTFSRWERFVASEIWMHTWVVACVLFAVFQLGSEIRPTPAMFASPWFTLTFFIAVAATCVFASILSIVLGSLFFDVLTDRQTVVNGGPFSVGDRVRIIAGQHAGSSAVVTSLSQARTPTLTLDETSAEVSGFSHYQLKRI